MFVSLPKNIVLATLCYKHTFYLCRNKFRAKKKHTTLKNSRRHFCLCLVWLLELTFFRNKMAKYQSARETIQISSTKHLYLYIFELCFFLCQAHFTSLIMALLYLYCCLKLADFFLRNFTFDSHKDLKLSRIKETVKFKYFSRSMDSFQGLFKTNFVFKDISRLPFIFKYFSSLCKPWVI